MEEKPIFKFAVREDLSIEQFMPIKAEPLATGWDVKSTLDLTIKPFQHVKIPLGFRTFCPSEYWFELKPRSSTFAKKNLHSLYGTIDETYEGELIFACQYIPEITLKTNTYFHKNLSKDVSDTVIFANDLIIKFGEAIGQIVPVKRQEMIVENISNGEFEKLCQKRSTIRGAGGFGSTDIKESK